MGDSTYIQSLIWVEKKEMTINFQSVCSSSLGNCLDLWSDTTKLLIDCGLSSMKQARRDLTIVFNDPTQIDTVLLTHMHGDHISYHVSKATAAIPSSSSHNPFSE